MDLIADTLTSFVRFLPADHSASATYSESIGRFDFRSPLIARRITVSAKREHNPALRVRFCSGSRLRLRFTEESFLRPRRTFAIYLMQMYTPTPPTFMASGFDDVVVVPRSMSPATSFVITDRASGNGRRRRRLFRSRKQKG